MRKRTAGRVFRQSVERPVRQKPMAQIVQFVCSGNTCRSPLAAAIFNQLAAERDIRDIVAESAGTSAVEGMYATPQAVNVARRHGIEIRRHRSRPFTRELADRSALILTMTGRQWYDATEIAPREKVALLPGLSGPDTEAEIADPYGGGEEEYEQVYDRLRREIEGQFPAIVERARAAGGSDP